MAEIEYWYNTRTGEVEKGKQSNSLDLAGPFRSAAEAAKAPEKIKANSERWAAEEAAGDSWKN